MDHARTAVAVERLLDAPVQELAQSGGPSVVPGHELHAWLLPDAAKRALASFGLPPGRTDGLMGVVGRPHASVLPESEHDGTRLYVLATYGAATIAAVHGSGDVLAVPGRTDVHPDLASLYPSGLQPALVNSSVEHFVECAWRWHWLLPLLAEAQAQAAHAEASRDGLIDETLDPYAGYQALCSAVLARFTDLDPGIRAGRGFWPEVIVDVW